MIQLWPEFTRVSKIQENPFLAGDTLTLIDPQKPYSARFYYKSIQTLRIESILSQHAVVLATELDTSWTRIELQPHCWHKESCPSAQGAQSLMLTINCQRSELRKST